jgi:hypothetical protein
MRAVSKDEPPRVVKCCRRKISPRRWAISRSLHVANPNVDREQLDMIIFVRRMPPRPRNSVDRERPFTRRRQSFVELTNA